MNFVCFNGQFHEAHQPLVTIQNRCFKYGDGLFETMKIINGKIQLWEHHLDRLILGLKLLKIQALNLSDPYKIYSEIIELCKKNNCLELARVRLAVYRTDQNGEYAIEALPLQSEFNLLNVEGFKIDLFPDIRKSQDAISNIKSANYLPYILAEIYARQNNLDDCLVLNVSNHICDGSKANIFLVRKNEIFTPALNQGCIDGVMRRYLIDELKRNEYIIHQKEIIENDLIEAEEIFLTNAIYGMRWVKQFREKQYSHDLISKIYDAVYSPLFN